MASEPIPAPHSALSGDMPSYYRRNARAFTVDMGLFQIGESLISMTTVIPAFVATLTTSEVLVGLASGIGTGAWLLPQLFIAGYVTRMVTKRPFAVRMAFVRGPMLLPIAAAALLFAQSAPGLTLAITLLSILVFYVLDAMVSVPFFDLMARGLPQRRRGRVQGLAGVFGGVGGMGAGALVSLLLGTLAYPANFAVLFVLSTALFLLSATALAFVHEPPPTQALTAPPSVRQVLGSLPDLLRRDGAFCWMMIVRLLAGFASVASAFYVLHATRNLGFAQADTGLFVSAQVAGLLGSGLLIGLVQDRWGPRTHQRLNMLISLLPPALALLAVPAGLSPDGPGPGLRTLFIAIYFFLGLYASNTGWPYFNWIMEHAPEAQRPLYIGITNTLAAVFMLAPVLGGLIVREISYPAVFFAAIAFALLGLVFSSRVPSTRKAEGR